MDQKIAQYIRAEGSGNLQKTTKNYQWLLIFLKLNFCVPEGALRGKAMRTPSYVSRAPDEYDKAYDAGYEAYSEGKGISSYEFRQDYNYSLILLGKSF